MKIDRLFFLIIFISLLLLTSNGCVHHNLPGQSTQRLLGKKISTLMYDDKSRHEIPKDPAGIIIFPQVIELALKKNPDLSIFSLEIRASESEALQASLLSNPEVDIEMNNISSYGKNETTIWLGQLIELGGKINRRTKLAKLDSDLAVWDYKAKKLEVLTEAVKAFSAVISAQERLKLHKELVSLSEKFLNSVNRRIKAGKVSPAESSRALVELSISRIELEKSRNELNACRHRLSAVWGSLEPKFEKVMGSLGILTSLPSFSKLKTFVDQNPDIARWAVEIEQRKINLELQKAGKIPDPTVRGGYARSNDTGENSFQLSVSVPIPIFNLNQGAIEVAEIRLEQANKQIEAISVKLLSQLKELYNLLSSAHQEVLTLKNKTIPEANNAYKLIDKYYIQGKYSFIDVLYARRTLFEVKARYLVSLQDYNKYIADIERLIGQRLDKIK